MTVDMKKKDQVQEFIEEDYPNYGTFMSSEAYGQMLDSVVFTCIDIIPVYDNKILLGKRTRHPQADWWIFGGRMRAGETIDAATTRLLRNEMSIDFDETKIHYLTTLMVAWKLRAHAPVDHGTHNTSLMYVLELDEKQVSEIRLNDEYSDMKFVSHEEVMSDEDYHPALRYCASLMS